MNKIILLIAALSIAGQLSGQINETGFVFRLNGNYNETTTSNALRYINKYEAESKNGSVSLSAGYLHKHWLFGLGFEYNHNKTEANVIYNFPVTYDSYITISGKE